MTLDPKDDIVAQIIKSYEGYAATLSAEKRKQFQREALAIMARGDTIKEVKASMPEVSELFLGYKDRLLNCKVPITELIFTKMLSKDSDAYTANTVETGAMYDLVDEGKTMRAGQVLQYVISDNDRHRKRSVPVELINEKTTYDAKRYIELLAKTGNSVTERFGFILDANEYATRSL
jgi:DNA polymerase elongation subunit (family B)